MTLALAFCLFYVVIANPNDQTQIEKYNDRVKSYQLDVPGKDPITIIETGGFEDLPSKWDDSKAKSDDLVIKNLMTHVVHDVNGNRPRCYGPSCQEGFIEDEGPQEFDDYSGDKIEKLKDFGDFSNERLQAIAALAAKLKKQKIKTDRYSSLSGEEAESDDNGKVFSTWNRLKVKQHKHPYDDKDGWVTLEPVAWSTSKISKWKPNVKKQKPSYWNEDEDTKYSTDDNYSSYQDTDSDTNKYSYNYPQKKPSLSRPGFINNKLHIPPEYDMEMPSKPSWTKKKPTMQQSVHNPQMSIHNLQSSWSPDDSRRPNRPNCDKDESYPNEDNVYYGSSDSLITDSRPANFPYDYEALHQSSLQRRPMRRPTQVIYADAEPEDDRSSRPYSDGQWVLLSTTKGYRNKKRHRSLDLSEENNDVPSITSHQSVSLTVLPADNIHTNMTTSHGGLLEVEKSFQTVEESKRDMDKKNDLQAGESEQRPVKKVIRKKLVPTNSPDSSTVLAAVGAGMLPATMAMVVPMMLGRRRRRRDVNDLKLYQLLQNQ